MTTFFDRTKASWDSLTFGAALVNIGLALVTTGIHAAILTAIQEAKPNPVPDPFSLFNVIQENWKLFSATAPLTIAIALIATIAWPDSGNFPPGAKQTLGSMFEYVFGVACIFLLFIWLTTWIGNIDLSNEPDWIANWPGPFSLITILINFLGKYYTYYGHLNFWSSVVLGACLGLTFRSITTAWASPRI